MFTYVCVCMCVGAHIRTRELALSFHYVCLGSTLRPSGLQVPYPLDHLSSKERNLALGSFTCLTSVSLGRPRKPFDFAFGCSRTTLESAYCLTSVWKLVTFQWVSLDETESLGWACRKVGHGVEVGDLVLASNLALCRPIPDVITTFLAWLPERLK